MMCFNVVDAKIKRSVDKPPSLEPHTRAALLAQPHELGLDSRWMHSCWDTPPSLVRYNNPCPMPCDVEHFGTKKKRMLVR